MSLHVIQRAFGSTSQFIHSFEQSLFTSVHLLNLEVKSIKKTASSTVKTGYSEAPICKRSLKFDHRSNQAIVKPINEKNTFLGNMVKISNALDKEEKAMVRKGKGEKKARLNSSEVQMKGSENTGILKIMDVDRIPIKLLHQLFLSQLVRWVPAERCISLASRIARCRDSDVQTMHRNLHNDIVKLVGDDIAPEIVAVLPRVQNTIPIPFMIDYIRRFGQFSKEFIALAVDKSLETRLFDFVRYQYKPKRIPLFITRPHSLLAYVQLMKDSTSKRLLLYNLDPSPLHRQNLLELGFPVPQLPLQQFGPSADPSAPIGMRENETMTEFENKQTYKEKRHRLGTESIQTPNMEFLTAVIERDAENTDLEPLLHCAYQELRESQDRLRMAPENPEGKPKVGSDSQTCQNKRDTMSSYPTDLSTPSCHTVKLSWDVPHSRSNIKTLDHSAMRLQTKRVVEDQAENLRPSLMLTPPTSSIRHLTAGNLHDPTNIQSIIEKTVTRTITDAKKRRRHLVLKCSKRPASADELSKSPALPSISQALTVYEDEAARRWREDYQIRPWWRLKRFRCFVYKKKSYLLTKDGWTRIGATSNLEEKKNNKIDTESDFVQKTAELKNREREISRKLQKIRRKAAKKRAELCVKAESII